MTLHFALLSVNAEVSEARHDRMGCFRPKADVRVIRNIEAPLAIDHAGRGLSLRPDKQLVRAP